MKARAAHNHSVKNQNRRNSKCLTKKILIALECTDENNVIEEAIRLAETLNADLSAFHVNDPAAGKAHMMMDTLPLVSEADIREQFRKAGG